jgi:hypothetical protein
MSVVEILKKFGGVTIPDEVIQAAKRESAKEKAQKDENRKKEEEGRLG